VACRVEMIIERANYFRPKLLTAALFWSKFRAQAT